LNLRDPVSRAYSHLIQKHNLTTFETLNQEDHEILIEFGHYNSYIKGFFDFFRRDQFLILIFEQFFADIPNTKETIANFLEIDVERFPLDSGTNKINKLSIPRYPTLRRFLKKLRLSLLQKEYYRLLKLGRRLKIKKLAGDAGSPPTMSEAMRHYLNEIYKDECEELETLLGIDLYCWRS